MLYMGQQLLALCKHNMSEYVLRKSSFLLFQENFILLNLFLLSIYRQKKILDDALALLTNMRKFAIEAVDRRADDQPSLMVKLLLRSLEDFYCLYYQQTFDNGFAIYRINYNQIADSVMGPVIREIVYSNVYVHQ